MDPKISLTCPGCGRSIQLPRAALVTRLEQGKPLRCTYCAKDLEVPADVRAQLDSRKQAASATSVTGRCPACLRPARAQGTPPLLFGTCVHCAVRFRCDGPGKGTLDLPAQRPAGPEEVAQAAERLQAMAAGPLLVLAVQKRHAAGALEAGEALSLAAMLAGMQGWRPALDEAVLPLSVAEALHVLGPLVLDSQFATVDEAQGIVRLSNGMVVGPGPSAGLSPGAKLAANFVGIGLLAVTGTGFTVSGGEPPPESQYVSREVTISAVNSPRGAVLRGSITENGAPTQPMRTPDLLELVRRVFERRELLSNYLRLRCLCGPAVRGAAAKALTRDAILRRLQEVGATAADAQKFAGAFLVA